MDNTMSITTGYELALTQKRAWQLQEQYNCACKSGLRIELNGPLDSSLLFTCLAEIAGHHEIFSTRFEKQDASLAYPFQVIGPEKTHPLLILTDISGIGWEKQEETIQKNWQVRVSAKPIEGETLEAVLLKQNESLHTLLLTVPAMTADAQSLLNIADEMMQEYAAGNTKAGREEDQFQFAQFSEWHNELLAADEPESKRFWASRLENYKPVAVPLENNNLQQAGSFEIIEELVTVDSEKIQEYCRTKKYSTPQFLFSAWAVFAWHYADKKEILSLGKIFTGRSLDHFEKICGPFAKTLPLQLHITGNDTFDDVYRNVQLETGRAAEWQDNFTWKYGNRDQLQAGAFSFEHIHANTPVISGSTLSVQYKKIHSNADWFKLKLSCFDTGTKTAVQMQANTSFFTREALVCACQQFSHLVNSILEEKLLPVTNLFTASPWEMKVVREKFNNTQRNFNTTRSLVSYMEEEAQNNPGATALKSGDTVINWQSFNEKANQWANYLSAQFAIGKGDVVAVSLERSPIQIICLFAILKTGAAYLPLDHNIPEERIAYILEDSTAKVLITADGLAGDIPAATKLVAVSGTAVAVERLSKKYSSVKREAEDTFYVMYTSGSTGKPKGVLVPDRGIINYALWFQSEHIVTRKDSSVLFSSIAFDLSYTALWPVLISGGALHLAADSPVFDPDNLLRILTEEKISYIKLTPSHFNLLVNSNLFTQLAPSLSLRLIVLGGEPVQVNDIEYYLQYKKGTSFLNHYGPTETTVGVISHLVDTNNLALFQQKPLIGKPNSNNQVYILDETNQPVPIGMMGEICVAGESVTNGYLQRPNLTKQKFIFNPFSPQGKMYKTGDLGRWTAGGQIEFFGRKDFQVKIHGYRIELEEIERVLHSFEGVTRVYVTVNNNGDGLLAFFTVSQPVSITALKQFAGRKLPDYMMPGLLMEVEQFPLLANGKIDRTNLLNTSTMQTAQNDVALPQTDLEKELEALWKKELGNNQFGIHDNFFDIGGNSFKLVGVFREFSKTYPGKIGLTDLFKYNTIHSLAAYLDSKQQVAEKEKQPNFSFEV
jgi:amino acid adenylation domain-containing protein